MSANVVNFTELFHFSNSITVKIDEWHCDSKSKETTSIDGFMVAYLASKLQKELRMSKRRGERVFLSISLSAMPQITADVDKRNIGLVLNKYPDLKEEVEKDLNNPYILTILQHNAKLNSLVITKLSHPY